MIQTSTSVSDLLLGLMQDLSMAQSIEEISGLVNAGARRLGQAQGATLVLREGDLCHYLDEDAIEPLWRGKRFPQSVCISGWVMQNRQPAIIANVLDDERIPQTLYRETFVKSMTMVPIRSRDPIGAIGFYWDHEREVSEDELKLFTIFADAVSIAVERLRLLLELEQSTPSARPQADENGRDTDEMIKLCSWTSRIDANGQWMSIEDYLQDTFGVAISHGISPEGVEQVDKLMKGDREE
jgi:GAF domain-containing protein